MTAITLVSQFNTTPQTELVNATVTDGYTYHSKKFQTIFGAIVYTNTDSDMAINVTWSADLATINVEGGSAENMTLELFGKLQEDSP